MKSAEGVPFPYLGWRFLIFVGGRQLIFLRGDMLPHFSHSISSEREAMPEKDSVSCLHSAQSYE